MFAFLPRVLSQSGIYVRIISIETTDEFLLMRVHSQETKLRGHHNTPYLAALERWLYLTNSEGMELKAFQAGSAGEGPFAGQIDIAFLLDPRLDLRAPLTLKSDALEVTFTAGEMVE